MIDRLIHSIKKTEAPIVVGLDPSLSFIPANITRAAYKDFGETLDGAGEAIWQFNKAIIDATYDLIPAVKPQIAMYERYGLSGLAAFIKTVNYAKEKGLIVIGDAKRGDIGSTSEAYADAHLGRVSVGNSSFAPFNEDFVTVNPYLGSDGVKPFIDVCERENKGIFVLVKTSNKSSGEFQDRLVECIDGNGTKNSGDIVSVRSLYEIVGEMVSSWGEAHIGKEGYSFVGAVVGATYPKMAEILRQIMPKTYILVPGYGAQGGKGSDLAPFFNKDGLGAIVNSSRGIIAAYKDKKYEAFGSENFADAARQATKDAIADIRQRG